MSAITQTLPNVLRSFLILCLAAFGSAASPLHATSRPCDSTVPLAPGETWRDPGGEAGDGACFELGLDSGGILMLDVSTSVSAAQARLILTGSEATASGAFSRLQQSATGLVLDAPPGSYRVRVETEDPRQRLPPFILRARFAAGIAKSETDSEIEVDPDPFAGGPSRHDLSAASAPVRSALAELCRQGEADDHGDVFACATALALEARAYGEIGSDWGDDADVFRFEVTALVPVEIRVRGAQTELAAELYDRHGQRLAVATGDSGDPRLVRSLVPGTYFVRIESRDGGEGRYSVRIGSPAR